MRACLIGLLVLLALAAAPPATKAGPALGLTTYPNPFRMAAQGQVTLAFTAQGEAHLRIVDRCLHLIRHWDAQAALATGRVAWDGRDDSGARVPPGLYIALLDQGPSRLACKITVLR